MNFHLLGLTIHYFENPVLKAGSLKVKCGKLIFDSRRVTIDISLVTCRRCMLKLGEEIGREKTRV